MFNATVRMRADGLSRDQFANVSHLEEDNVGYAIAHDHSFGDFRLDARNDEILKTAFAHFSELTQCDANFSCPGAAYAKEVQTDKFSCTCKHVCSNVNCGKDGTCVFNEITKATTCKCQTSTLTLYYGDHCETSTLKFEVVLGISVGAGLVLLLVIFLFVVCRNRKSDKASMSYDPREWDLPSETGTGKPQDVSYRAWSTRSSVFGDRYYRHFPSNRKFTSDTYNPFSSGDPSQMRTAIYLPPSNEYDTDRYSVGGASSRGVASGRGGTAEGGGRSLRFIDPSQDYSIVRPQVDTTPRDIYRPLDQGEWTDGRGTNSRAIYTDARTFF
ncbi:hypothetical protein KP79_PYT24113 [Mizuhopecten yessoensis]|uniref:EGF-like domain-containing protein n=1 Tax=Mizuhopecten yessoensis TaxID=6573 RepID=A0A210Q678_MIZYE|nr:hypothetical protein KP79_PYT24113 [Mizuhopecten yessoensis]